MPYGAPINAFMLEPDKKLSS